MDEKRCITEKIGNVIYVINAAPSEDAKLDLNSHIKKIVTREAMKLKPEVA